MNPCNLFLLFLCSSISARTPEKLSPTITKEPSVVIVFVIDQFPAYYLTRHQHNFKHNGFKRFTDQGVFYTKAYHAHGIPETSPGHASMSSGVFPRQHGATGNHWLKDGKVVEFSVDNRKEAAEIHTPISAPGRSPHQMEVDTISDQMGIHQATKHVYKAYSVSVKPRSAIATAGQHTLPFWFNTFQGGFTSSNHYMRELPRWVKTFNEQSGVKKIKTVSWDLFFDPKSDAYDYKFIDNYDHAAQPLRLAGNNEILIDRRTEDPYVNYLRTPTANKLILDFATTCIKENYKKEPNEKLLLWVCLSPLDLVGHIYGPDSREVIDLIYHLDKQLDTCITDLENLVGSNNVTFILTADHGIQPMQEISQQRGMKKARRIIAKDLMAKVNRSIEEEFGVKDFLGAFQSSYFTYNQEAVDKLTIDNVLEDAEKVAKEVIALEPGVKQVWTCTELKKLQCQPMSDEQFYKNHLAHGRLGDLIIQPHPYCLVTKYPTGCSHNTPYEYDTHVPLGFYQQGMSPKKIRRSVFVAQLAPTIAQILNIQAPSASLMEALPHMLTEEK